jgi:hypothetical protein
MDMYKFLSILLVVHLCAGAYAETRIWALVSGKSIEAEYVSLAFNKVFLKTPDGKQITVPIEQFSEEDRVFLELENPPILSVDFKHKSNQLLGYYKSTPFLNRFPPNRFEHTFKIQVQKTSTEPYNHPLHVEYFAIGRQLQDRDKYILMEKKESEFSLDKPSGYSFEMAGSPVSVIKYEDRGKVGRAFAGYLVVVTDSRGKVIAHNDSSNRLFNNYERLKERKVGDFMDNTCTRVYASGPRPRLY